MEMPAYLITGFLESGKTSFIEQVILEGNFVEDDIEIDLSFARDRVDRLARKLGADEREQIG